MKFFIYLFIVMSLPTIGSAQNATITIGRGTDCFGRGACSITIENSSEYNATFLKNIDGTMTLRIYRLKLTKENEDRLFGVPITEFNIDSLNFRMEEEIPISSATELLPSSINAKELGKLKIGVYSTTITTSYIDIQILNE